VSYYKYFIVFFDSILEIFLYLRRLFKFLPSIPATPEGEVCSSAAVSVGVTTAAGAPGGQIAIFSSAAKIQQSLLRAKVPHRS
jgi:hypothetical protein